jgi:outer membrane lipoprotein SlyB
MENIIHTAPHAAVPVLYKAAAVSVIALSFAGIGAMTGYLPVRKADLPQPVAAATTPPAPAVAAPAVAAVPTPPAAPVAERAAKPRIVKATPRRVEEPTASASPVSTHPVAVSSSGSNQAPYPAYPQSRDDAPYYPKVAQAPVPARSICNSCGTIESVRTVEKPGEASGVGIAGGALGGGVLGRQFGNGRGRDVLTVLGAIGGGIAGNQIEKSVRTSKSYEVTVRMEDGSMRTVTSATQPNWRAGERVRVDGNNISVDYS